MSNVKVSPALFIAIFYLVGCSSVENSSSNTDGGTTSVSTTTGSSTTDETSLGNSSESESTTDIDTETATGGDLDCPQCSTCSDDEICIARCTINIYEGVCGTVCLPKGDAPFSTELEACNFDEYLCGPDMGIVGFRKDSTSRACGDVLCSKSCDICSSCDWHECSVNSPCELGYNCSPILVFGNDIFYDWRVCLPSGDSPVGSPCTHHNDYDECVYGAACVFETCRTPCGKQDSCPQGFHCMYIQNWVGYCYPS